MYRPIDITATGGGGMQTNQVPCLAMVAMTLLLLCGCAGPATPVPTASATPPEATDAPGNSLTFTAQYLHTTGPLRGSNDPEVTVIATAEEAQACSDGDGPRLTGGTLRSLAEPLATFDEAYFREHLLVLVTLQEPSGSIRHRVTAVTRDMEALTVHIQRILPDGAATADMAVWHILVELPRADAAGLAARAVVTDSAANKNSP
jgi:hypothetical protein